MVTEVEALLSFIFNEELRLPGVEGVTSEGYNTEGGFHICPNSALVDLLDQGYLRRKDAMCLKFQELKEGLLPSDSDRLQLARRSWASKVLCRSWASRRVCSLPASRAPKTPNPNTCCLAQLRLGMTGFCRSQSEGCLPQRVRVA